MVLEARTCTNVTSSKLCQDHVVMNHDTHISASIFVAEVEQQFMTAWGCLWITVSFLRLGFNQAMPSPWDPNNIPM